jgi:ABC-type multidrug transport system ATPase subunit
LKKNCDNLDSYVNQIQKDALELLQLVIKFDFEEFFDLNEKVNSSAELIDGKDIILLLGSTGSGKSTTIHYLSGSTMKRM